MEFPEDSCWSTLAQGTCTPGKPVGSLANDAKATSLGYPPARPANEGLGPEGLKKLKNAAVPTNWPFRGANGPGQFRRVPRARGAITWTPHVLDVAPISAAGATTPKGLLPEMPAARALRRFCAKSFGSVESMFRGRFKCTP